MLVFEPQELRAWRIRLGATQDQVAKRAKCTQHRVAEAEAKVLGTVKTYIKINRALTAIQSEQPAPTKTPVAA